MVVVKEDELVIVIKDNSPEERRQWIIDALADMMRCYAYNPHKRIGDIGSVEVIADLTKELNQVK